MLPTSYVALLLSGYVVQHGLLYCKDCDPGARIPILSGSEHNNMEADCFRVDHVMIYCALIGVPETALGEAWLQALF